MPNGFDILEPESKSGGFDVIEPEETPEHRARQDELKRRLEIERNRWPAGKITDAAYNAVEGLTPHGLLSWPTRMLNAVSGSNYADPDTSTPLVDFQGGLEQPLRFLERGFHLPPGAIVGPDSPVSGVASALEDTASGLTSPESAAVLPAAMSPIGRMVMGGDILRHAPEQMEEAKFITQNPQSTVSDITKAHTIPLISLGMAAALARHGTPATETPANTGRVRLNVDEAELARIDQAARDAAALQEGSPFARSATPAEPVPLQLGEGVPQWVDPSGLGLNPEPVVARMARADIAASPEMQALLAREPGPTLQPPAPTIAPPYQSGRAAQTLRERAGVDSRAQDFPAAVAEKVSQEQKPAVHPEKPLTENQLKIIQDSLKKAVSENQFPEAKKGGYGEGVLEALRKGSDEASARLEANRGQINFNMGPLGELPNIRDFGIVLANKIARGGYDLATWTADAVKQWGEGIKPHIQAIWDYANNHVNELKGVKNELQQSATEKALSKIESGEVNAGGAKVTEAQKASGVLTEPGKIQVGPNPIITRPPSEYNARDVVQLSGDDFIRAVRSSGRGITGLSYDWAKEITSSDIPRMEQTHSQIREAVKSGQADSSLNWKSQIYDETIKMRKAMDEAISTGARTDEQLAIIAKKHGVGVGPDANTISKWLKSNLGTDANVPEGATKVGATETPPVLEKQPEQSGAASQPEIPAVENGKTRLYQGSGGAGGAGTGGSFFTSDPQRAASYGPNIHYVDVPADVFKAGKVEARKAGMPTSTDAVIPDEWVRKSKPHTPIEQVIHDAELDVTDKRANGNTLIKPAISKEYFDKLGDEKTNPQKWIEISKRSAKGDLASTESAEYAGLSLSSVKELDALVDANRTIGAEMEKVKAKRDFKKWAEIGMAKHFIRETIEVATNAGGNKETARNKIGDRPLDYQKNPEVEKWIQDKLSRHGKTEDVVPAIESAQPLESPIKSLETPGLISGSKLEKWADNFIAEKTARQARGEELGAGLDPDLMAAYVVKGAAMLERGVTDGAKWTAEMIKEHGKEIRPFLSDIRKQAEQLRAEHFNKSKSPAIKDEAAPRSTPAETASPNSQKQVPESTSEAMEKKVKLPVEKDVDKLREQLDTFNTQIGDALETGGQFLEKELRPQVAKGAPAEVGTVTNAKINQHFVDKLSTIRKQFNDITSKLAREADPVSQQYMKLLRDRFELSFRQVQELRRTSHESLYFWNKIKAEYQEIARSAGHMPEIKAQIPILDQIWKDFRGKDYVAGGKHFVDYLRMNLFTLGSWTLDFGTNLAVVASHAPAWALMDAAHLVTGNPAQRMASALRAIRFNSQGALPFTKRFRLNDRIEAELGNSAGAEFGGRGKEVMVDFSEILKDRPELASKLKNIDYILGGPVRMKRAVDTFFGRLGATAELYNEAYVQGRKKGLKGDDLKQFAEDFVSRPTEAAIEKAVQSGKEFKFNRDLSMWEEKFSSNILTKLIVEAFPRWTFQFTRWAGEMVGVDPTFARQVANKTATAEDVVKYLSKAATGWGGIVMFNQLFYNSIDANSMEYVDENGDRTRLSGRTPAAELFFVTALLRGDTDKAKAALQYISLPGARLLSGQAGGIISPLVDTIRESIQGRYTADQTAREMTKLVNDALPGKSVLGMARAILDPTIREGVGAPIPGVSDLLPQRVNPTTGEPLAPKQRIPGTAFEIPTIAGTPFPGAQRVLNDIEKQLLNHGLGLTRPRRTSIIDLPSEDVPREVRHEYEQMVGRNVKAFVGDGIKLKAWQDLPFDIRREVLQKWISDAQQLARAELAVKHGASGRSKKSRPLNINRLPETLKDDEE